MMAHLNQWFDLLFRWLHIITGIAWIGSSFYFNWLENNLKKTGDDLPEGVEGNLWSVHGGGFYYVEKMDNAPEEIPEDLHWFYWEAYFTWITGFCLLIIVYYFNASLYMVDQSVAQISPLTAILIGLGVLVGGWIVYHSLCKTLMRKSNVAFVILGFLLATGVAYGLTQVLSGRAAYIHVGAMLGTIMAANVFFVIIPAHVDMVEAAKKGEEPDPQIGYWASRRSLHNNYLTLPVLFIMISNHFPSTYGHEFNWAVLAGISVVGATVRHYFNIRHQPEKNAWILPVAAVGMIALALVTAPKDAFVREKELDPDQKVTFTEAQNIISRRCLSCHAENPADDMFSEPPLGIVLETPQQMKVFAPRIKARVVDTKTMPYGNITDMTEVERQILGRWVDQGAPIPSEKKANEE